MAIASVTLVTDLPGRLFLGLAALGLLTFAGVSWRNRPKLAIAEAGLVLGGWRGPRVLRRDEIEKIRLTEFRRIGRTVRLLEIESTDDRLTVLSRWDLGAAPLEVFDALSAAGFTGR